MIVIKRNGSQEPYEPQRIAEAIKKAMRAETGKENEKIALKIMEEITEELADVEKVGIDIIEKMVYSKLIRHHYSNVARAYEDFRSVREYQRKHNTIDNRIIGIVKGNNYDIKDNSNKNTSLISTMRDLVAEEVSKDISLRTMLPTDIANAHNEGLIYIHDLGHYLNPSFNCCLLNLEDMLQNGTVINGKKICKPHSFRTACTIATQIIAQVASGQFGGQTITLTHLAPFIRISEEKFRHEVDEEFNLVGVHLEDSEKEKIVQKRLKEEIAAGVQTLQYQINTLQTSNGRQLCRCKIS